MSIIVVQEVKNVIVRAAGKPGTNGTNGVGVPAGGTEGLPLVKQSATDYDTIFALLGFLGLQARFKTRVTSNVVTSYAIDRDNGNVFVLTMTGATTFTDDNLASGTDTEDIFVILTGNFVPTFPGYWEATPDSDSYDGTVRNLITVSTINGNGGSEDVIYEIKNLTT